MPSTIHRTQRGYAAVNLSSIRHVVVHVQGERFGFAETERTEQQQISGKAGDPFYQLFCAGQADGSIDPRLPLDSTYLALVSSLVGVRQRLSIETKWTTGVDKTAREVHALLIDVWRKALRPS
jgi:hypothetical protein